MALTKVSEAALLAIVSTAAAAATVGTDIDVSTYYGATARVRMGRGTGTAFTAAPEIRIEGALKASPSANDWVTLWRASPALGSSLASQAVSGTLAAGSGTATLAAGTNFGADDFVFFHNTTLANSEWKHVVSVSGAVLTLQDNLVNAQTGATARDQAEEYSVQLDLTSVYRLRVVVDNSVGAQAFIVEAGLSAVSAL